MVTILHQLVLIASLGQWFTCVGRILHLTAKPHTLVDDNLSPTTAIIGYNNNKFYLYCACPSSAKSYAIV